MFSDNDNNYVCVVSTNMLLILRNKEAEVRGLREQINLFTEAVAAKDHVVVELTNKVCSVYKQFLLHIVIRVHM